LSATEESYLEAVVPFVLEPPSDLASTYTPIIVEEEVQDVGTIDPLEDLIDADQLLKIKGCRARCVPHLMSEKQTAALEDELAEIIRKRKTVRVRNWSLFTTFCNLNGFTPNKPQSLLAFCGLRACHSSEW
jgi:hypothetical protein